MKWHRVQRSSARHGRQHTLLQCVCAAPPQRSPFARSATSRMVILGLTLDVFSVCAVQAAKVAVQGEGSQCAERAVTCAGASRVCVLWHVPPDCCAMRAGCCSLSVVSAAVALVCVWRAPRTGHIPWLAAAASATPRRAGADWWGCS